jgi:hypothetical protein
MALIAKAKQQRLIACIAQAIKATSLTFLPVWALSEACLFLP